MEEREAHAHSKALQLVDDFSSKFRFIGYTLHPGDIPGESAGKGSNVAWAARKLSERYPIEKRKNIVVTGIDGKWIPASKNFGVFLETSLKPSKFLNRCESLFSYS